jgi:hypothetical protein
MALRSSMAKASASGMPKSARQVPHSPRE